MSGYYRNQQEKDADFPKVLRMLKEKSMNWKKLSSDERLDIIGKIMDAQPKFLTNELKEIIDSLNEGQLKIFLSCGPRGKVHLYITKKYGLMKWKRIGSSKEDTK